MSALIGSALGILRALASARRRRVIVLERRSQLAAVLDELSENLAGLRRVWSSGRPMNWRAWLHLELLSTRAWRDCRSALTTSLDGGPVVLLDAAELIDRLYAQFEDPRHAWDSSYEPRGLELADRLRALLGAYPVRRWERLVTFRRGEVEIPDFDHAIVSPQTPGEMQGRALARSERAWSATPSGS